MKSATMEIGASYADTGNKTGSPHYIGTGIVQPEENKDIPTLLGLSFVALLLVVASVVVMV